MSLLVVDHVSHRAGSRRSAPELRDVTFDIECGELVVLWGRRQATRSLLAKIAAGIVPPDQGTVAFAGRDLRAGSALGRGIGWVSSSFDPTHGTTVADQMLAVAQQRGRSKPARERAVRGALHRAGVAELDDVAVHDLDPLERWRCGVARALIAAPGLLVAVDPTADVSSGERHRVEATLRACADDGLAVLATSAEVLMRSRLLSVHEDGSLAGDAVPSAPVISIPKRGAQ